MKLFKKLTMFIIAFVLVISIGACNGEDNTGEEPTIAPDKVTVVGEYLIDISEMGMPLKFYLKINADNTFILSPDRKFDVDKGSGSVASSGTTYMLIYSDSTPENSKNTTFEMDNHNINFKTDLSYGTSKLPASIEDEDDPEIVHYLVGMTLLYEDYYGEFSGEHTTNAPMGKVTYHYTFIFGMGRNFTFTSEYRTMGKDYDYTEKGYYDVVDGEITLHIKGEEEIKGNFDSELNLDIPVKASDRGDREMQSLKLATTAACSNNYYGYYEVDGTILDISIYLDKYGGYEYVATSPDDVKITETGSFTIAKEDLVFSPADQDVNIDGKLSNYILTGNFPIKADDTRDDVKLYCQTIQGQFRATAEDSEENTYVAELELLNTGIFTFKLTQNEEIIFDETGEFTVTKSMFVQLVLTGEDDSFSAVLSDTGLNMSIVLTEDLTVGFSLLKDK